VTQRYFIFFLGALVLTRVEAQQYVMSTIPGLVLPPTPAAGPSRPINPLGVAVDASGNAYIPSGDSVFKLDPQGVLTRIAGNGTSGYSGDGGPATDAALTNARAVALDPLGNAFIIDGYRVRRISSTGIITTVAGNRPGTDGDGGPAADALLYPSGLAVNAAGDLFIAEFSRVRKVSPNGIITTTAQIDETGSGISVTGIAVDRGGTSSLRFGTS